MILQILNELYDRLLDDPRYEIAKIGFSMQKITFRIVLHPDGRLNDIQDTRIQEGDDKKRYRPRQMLVPGDTKPSGSGLNPCFLWDTSAYMLGYTDADADEKKTKRVADSFAAFRDYHLTLEDEIGNSEFSAVCRFLDNWDAARCEEFPILDELQTGYGVFQIIGESGYVHDVPGIRKWWLGRLTEAESEQGQCLVTAGRGTIAKTQKKIKGIAGGKSDMSLVSFNADAYESYGKEQSYNAPVLESVSFRYGTALNALLDGPMRSRHRRRLADDTVAFWTGTPTVIEDVFAAFVMPDHNDFKSEETQDEARLRRMDAFFRAMKEGKEAYSGLAEDPDSTHFYILGMAPNAARIAVRYFLKGSVTELLDNLRLHQMQIGTRKQYDSEPMFPSNTLLLAQTGRTTDDIPPLLAGALMRSVILGTKYPVGLYSAVLRRIIADREINYPRACIIKGYHVRNQNKELPMSLDTTRAEPAYRLGRLFAVLEKTQGDALSTLKAGIRERYYASASATPASVFPRLLRTYQHHLAKLDGGHKINREKLLQEILQPLTSFPSHFGMNDQGLFALGYYHQRQDLFTKKSDNSIEEEAA